MALGSLMFPQPVVRSAAPRPPERLFQPRAGACLVLVLALMAVVDLATARWTVLGQDDGGFVAEWTSDEAVADTIPIARRRTLRPYLDGAQISGEIGAPGVPLVGTFVAAPAGIRPEVGAMPGPYEVHAGWLAPVPTPVPRDDGLGFESDYRPDVQAYARYEAPSLVRVEAVGTVRGTDVYRIALAPVRFDPTRETIAVARRVTVTVHFPGAPAARRAAGRGLPEFWGGAVVNADQARTWTSAPAPRAARVAASPLVHGTWMRVIVRRTGIHRLHAAEIIAADSRFQDVALDHLAMFTGSGTELPLRPTAPRATSLELVRPIVVDADGNSRLTKGDEVLFYGESLARWTYAPCASLNAIDGTDYVLDRYTTENVYWLAVVDTVARHGSSYDGTVTDPNLRAIDRYMCRIHEEPENFNFDEEPGMFTDGPTSGLDWGWTMIEGARSEQVQATLYDMASDTIWARIGQLTEQTVVGVPSTPHYVQVGIQGQSAAADRVRETGTYRREQTFHAVVPSASQRSVLIELASPNGGRVTLDYWEVHYWRRLIARTDTSEIAFTLPPLCRIGPDEPVQVLLQGINRDKQRLFDVTENGLVEVALPPPEPGGVTRVRLARSGTVEREYLLTMMARFQDPVRLERAAPTADLRGRTAGVDYLIITHPDFLTQARRLADWRARPDGGGFRTAIVTTRDIYDEFASGLFDPAAIRDFIRFATEHWRDGANDPGLRYVVLLGDGHYDFRYLSALSRGAGMWVPPYEEGPTTTDDWFVIFSDAGLPEVQIGRFAVQTPTDGREVVEKILAYESGADRGDWQNRVILASDDEFNPDLGLQDETVFVNHSELLAGKLRPETVVEKVYEFEYQRDEQLQRPGAAAAFRDAWTRGALLVNYIGHGSPVLWAHERLFVLERDLSRIHNNRRLPIVSALTCSAAHFDDPARQSIGEAVVNYALADGGAIATVASTRLVENAYNTNFGGYFLDELFRGASRRPRLGDAFWAAKARLLASPDGDERLNTRRFILIGDPATAVALPELPLRVVLDADSLSALGSVTINGAVLAPDRNDTLRSFNGKALVHLFDSATPALHVTSLGVPVRYQRNGLPIFRGEASVVSGRFSIQAIVPREVVYGGTNARAVAQAWNNQIDGAGARTGVPIRSSLRSGEADTVGPTITFARAGDPDQVEPLADGAKVVRSDPVRIWIGDPSGINVTGEIGHRLLARIAGQQDPIDLSRTFVHWGSATRGFAEIDLPEGPSVRQVTVEAWDNWNNFSADSVVLRVVDTTQDLTLHNVIALPNPMDGMTTFTWITSGLGDGAADATVRVYTIAGRLVETMTKPDLAEGPAVVPWRPEETLANGVYLYRITVRRRSDGRTAQAIERLAVLGP